MNFSISRDGADGGEVERLDPSGTMVVQSGIEVGQHMLAELHRLESIEISHRRMLSALDKLAREYRRFVLPKQVVRSTQTRRLELEETSPAWP